MDEKGSIIKYLFETITKVFALSLFGLGMSGWILSNFEWVPWQDSGISVIGSEGISYEVFFQFFALSVVLGVLTLIFLSDFFLSKYMLVWRYMIFLGSALVTLSLFVVLFSWFPAIWQGWVSLLGLFTAFSAISMIPTFIKLKREDKEYEKALSEYKSKQAE